MGAKTGALVFTDDDLPSCCGTCRARTPNGPRHLVRPLHPGHRIQYLEARYRAHARVEDRICTVAN
jgi:hypothetical protein